jgi:ABC-2 type transport system permease protein
MAELADWTPAPWTQTQSRAQLAAIAWLRWRIFVNSFRYKNKRRSTTSFVLILLVRIFVWGILACLMVGPVLGSGFAAYYMPQRLGAILWTIFSVQFFISLNITPAVAGFDLKPLLRFPIRFSQYLLIKLFFGLLSIPTVVATLCIAASAVGLGVKDHALFLWAALVLGVFALGNVFFLRMTFLWVDRWLATRRAREVFGGLVLVASLSFQLLVVGNRGHHGQHLSLFTRIIAMLHPILQYLPPSLAAGAVLNRTGANFVASYACLFGLVAFALMFLAIFAVRLQKEFHGEELSETDRRTPRPESQPSTALPEAIAAPSPAEAVAAAGTPGLLPPTVAACLQKELLYLKRSGAQLYGLVAPMFFVFIIARTNKTISGSSMFLPYAVSYMMLGLLANLYNVLGADGPGFQLYLLAPVRLRDALIAKNLVNSSVIAGEVLLAILAVALIGGGLPPTAMLAATLLWAAFALLLNLSIGNLRSLLAPMRFELGKVRRAPVAKGGVLISLGVIFATIGVGLAVMFTCRHFDHPWLAVPIFLGLDVAAGLAYLTVLGRVDTIAADHREDLVEALTRAA